MEQSEEIVTVYGRCKCCLDYGYMKNMWEEHSWDGEREIYGEMILDTFGLSLNTTDNSKEYICESCVSRLRDAASFKKEIVASEQLLLEHATDSGDKEFIKAEIFNEENDTLNEPEKKKVKKEDPSQNEPTKYEIEFLDEDAELVQQSYNELNSQDNQDSDSDSIPAKKKKQGDVNRMYTKYTTEQLIKAVEAVYNNEMTELEASQRYNIPRRTLNARVNKRRMEAESNSQGQGDTASESDTVTKRKWPKKKKKEERSTSYRNYTHTDLKNCINAILNEEMNQVDAANFYNIPRKTVNCKINNIRKKTGDDKNSSSTKEVCAKKEIDKQRATIKTVLKYTNATPIRGHWGIGYTCQFCPKQYSNASDLKAHTYTHGDISEKIQVRLLFSYCMKLDMTGLECKICKSDMNNHNLNEIMMHLIEHRKKVYLDIKNYILPFKFDTNKLRCVICHTKYDYFKHLCAHMSEHFQNFICSYCGKGFVNKQGWKGHIKRHILGVFSCTYCQKKFQTMCRKLDHERVVHVKQCKTLKCGYCDERFMRPETKAIHETKEHGVPPPCFVCEYCSNSYKSRISLLHHVKSIHIRLRPHKCTDCKMAFYKKNELTRHRVTHTGERNYQCDVCKKSFGQRNTIIQHMITHFGEKRFVCDICSSRYLYKVSLKEHMLSKHGVELSE